jgi:holliday junction DNA helicase RuvA
LIAAVRGEVLVRRTGYVVVEASGVGYRLAVSAETLKTVPAAGQETSLHAETVARDDSILLYGFATEEERDLFVELIGVSGIGPKVALAALSGGAPRELTNAIVAGDAKRFQAVPGIGKRTAERIILELKDRIQARMEEAGAEQPEPEVTDARSLARDGLVNLGYTPRDAERMLDEVPKSDDPEVLLNRALREVAKGAGTG